MLFAFMNILGLIISVDAQVPTEKTLLWQVSGKGIAQPSFLFGTIHLVCPDDLIMPAIVSEKFSTTMELFLELDLDDPDMMVQMMKGMQMKDTTIDQLLGERYEEVSSLFQKFTGMPLSMMKSTKPFMLMSLIYPSLLGCAPASWETEFQKLANEKNMQIKGLEKLEEQMAVFEKIPYKIQSDMLANALLEADSTKLQFTQMMALYKEKDISKLNIDLDDNLTDYEGVLLNERNHNWIPIIGEQAKKMPTFFAFGAAHLGGEKGIINLLRKSGFSVKPIYYK